MTPNRKHVLALTLAALLAVSCGAKTDLFSGGSPCSIDGELCYRPSDCCSGICRDGLCSALACLPGEGPVELSAGHVWPLGIAQYRGHIFFTLYDGAGAVKRVPKIGGSTTTLVDGLRYPSGVAVDASGVYVAATNDYQVFRTGTSGGSVEVLAFGEDKPTEIALDATHVYWVNLAGDQVRRIAKTGGDPQTLASTPPHPHHLGIGPKFVYWADYSAGVHAVPKGGGDAVTHGDDGPQSFATDESYVYFTDYRTSGIRRMPLGGGPIEVLYESKGFWDGIAVDGTHVYATIRGKIVRIPKSGGDLELIAEGQASPTHIVVDEGCVYWTNIGIGWARIGNVMRAPKE